MNHIVDTCPSSKFEGGLNLLHEADDDEVMAGIYSDCSTREIIIIVSVHKISDKTTSLCGTVAIFIGVSFFSGHSVYLYPVWFLRY